MGWYEIKDGHRSHERGGEGSGLKEKIKEVKRLMGDICEEVEDMEDNYGSRKPMGYRMTDRAWRIEEEDERRRGW